MENQSGKQVKLYWYTYQGGTLPYETINNGDTIVRSTMATHPWEARPTDGSNTEILIDGQAVYTPGRTPTHPHVLITAKPSTISINVKNAAGE